MYTFPMMRLLLGMICPLIAFGERHAFLVGINEYTPAPGVTNLQGPVNDAVSLSNALTTQWGFAPANVKLIVNRAATRKTILDELSKLVDRVKPGDFVFIFFSGHGTSRYAPGMARSGLGLDTGAIVTADNSLIIGSLHLKPVLRRLDSIARVFASIDACYSGNSVRSLVKGTSKYCPFEAVEKSDLAAYDAQFSQFGSATDTDAEYPYRQLLYISAASKAEAAIDIPRAAIADGFKTVDGLPHGAFTNAMLIGLKGAADTNKDGVISYTELYQFTRGLVTRNFPHTPQFLYSPDDRSGAGSPVFAARSATIATTPAEPSVLCQKSCNITP